MKTGRMILSAASIIPLLSSCATYQKTSDSEAWSIKPAFNVRHSTGTPDAYYQLGRYYQGQNRYDQARVAYQKALVIDGTFAEARNGLGVIYATQGRQQEALEQFRLAVKQAPNAAHIRNNLGYALYLSGFYAEAASELERAVALEPSNQAAHTNLALALGKAGDREKAVQIMSQAAKLRFAENVPPVTHEAQQALALPKDWGVITQAARKTVPLVESSIQAVQLAPNVYELRERAVVQVQVASAAKPLQQASVQPNGRGEPPTQMMKQRFATIASLSPGFLPKGGKDGVSLREPHVKERDMVSALSVQKTVPASESRVQVVRSARAAAPIARPYRIEVSNGNGVTGMAKKVKGFLNKEGYSSARLTNQKPFHVASSQVQYRTGYREQAQSLALILPGQPGIAPASKDLRWDISIRVLLGKDLVGNVANFDRSQGKIHLARHGSDS